MTSTPDSRVSIGCPGLDDVLGGGLTPNCLYLIEGDPGSGKTTLGMQFLLAGKALGEPGLYVTLSETKGELELVAKSHGWDLSGIETFELIPSEESLSAEAQYRMFHPSEVELSETMKKILDKVNTIRPKRVVFDSLSELRLLAQNSLRYRRQILALKQFFIGRQTTVLLLDDRTTDGTADMQPQSIAHGVISLFQLAPEYGAERRRLRVAKMRGVRTRGGLHDFVIKRGGMIVFPRLIAAEHGTGYEEQILSSGIEALDKLMHGGLARGTSTLVLGPAGSGKSSIATQYVCAAGERGEKGLIIAFDESTRMVLRRANAIRQPLQKLVDDGTVSIKQVDPAELSPGELFHIIREAVEKDHVKIVVIDSLNGYMNAMPEERYLTLQLHELLTYLAQLGVTSILVVAQTGLMGASMKSPGDTSYLSDAVIMLRYFETKGAVHKALSVVKKRGGGHEPTIRDFAITSDGIQVGEPLKKFRGILTGVPVEEQVLIR